MTFDELRRRRAEIERIAESHGAGDVRIFGSVPGVTRVPGSDVDFLVELDRGRRVLDLSVLLLDLRMTNERRAREALSRTAD